MIRYKITIEYDGTNFIGWQRQDNGMSIQSSIENAIFKLSGENVTLFGSGRTDSGVHALGQVAHFDLKKNFNTNNIRDGLNQHLRPKLIAILKVEKTKNDFHARFSAKKRTYKYILTNRRAPLTVTKNKSWCVHKKLEINKMIKESIFFLGKNDLNAFRSVNCQSETTLRTIDEVDIYEKNNDIIINVSAKSFLHSQIRIMVGTLVEIGKGKIKNSVKDIIQSKNRERAGITAPACGLYLVKIDY